MFILLALASLAFAIATVLKASNLWVWKATIAATEFGHIAAVPIFVLGLLVFSPKVLDYRWYFKLPIAAIFFVSSIMLMKPAFQASALARSLNSDLTQAFGPKAQLENERGFSWLKAYFAGSGEVVKPEKIEFSHQDHSQGLMYFYRAQAQAVSQTKSPLVVVIHGGAWNSGEPLQLPELNSVLADEGYAVVTIGYRFMPMKQWPTQKTDVLDGLDYILAHSDQYGVDPGRIVVLGRSAGGQIAETIAFDPPSNLKQAIRGCIGFYSPADLNFAYKYGKDDDILGSLTLLRDYMGGTPEQKVKEFHTASAYDFVDSSSPPTLLFHGQHDELVWFKQSERLQDKMKSVGRPVLLVDLPWATHGFDFNINGPGGQISTESVISFLRAVM